MERYSGTQAMEAGQVDPVAEWAAPGGETGLEEPMWQLGLGGGTDSYPERPDEPDCIYYLRTGFCGYGNRCRFNHPRDRGTAMVVRSGGGEYPERVGQAVCQYYMRTGMCKFGASCKYHHPKHGVGPSAPVSLNFYGFPLRPGEKECSYYAKTAQCKFGVTCKFHHPQPAGIQMPVPTPGTGSLTASAALPTAAIYPTGPSPSIQSSQQYGMIQGNWPVPRPTMFPGTYVPGSYGPMLLPPGVVPVPGWTPYPAPASPVASPSTQVGGAPVYGITQLSPSAAAYTGPYLSITSSAGPSSSSPKENAFPQRPGHPECQYYLRTGDCKFGATCKYHHPLEWNASKTSFVLSPVGLPLRPGVPPCSHYEQTGVCRFGLSCKFDHPMKPLNYIPSASSLTDMPVAPYPMGSMSATLAPAYSSSDLRHGFSKMSSMSSPSVAVIFSRNEAVPQSGLQQSGKTSTGDGGEAHTSS